MLHMHNVPYGTATGSIRDCSTFRFGRVVMNPACRLITPLEGYNSSHYAIYQLSSWETYSNPETGTIHVPSQSKVREHRFILDKIALYWTKKMLPHFPRLFPDTSRSSHSFDAEAIIDKVSLMWWAAVCELLLAIVPLSKDSTVE